MSQLGTDGSDNFTATADIVYLLDGDDRVVTSRITTDIYGGEGWDVILNDGTGYIHAYGGSGQDNIHGSTNFDNIYGEDGSDLLVGGRYSHTNFLNTGDVFERLVSIFPFQLESSGNDYLDGGQDMDALHGFDGNDTLLGGDGNDTNVSFSVYSATSRVVISTLGGLYGGSGNDYLDGGSGSDWLDGGSGNDTLFGGTGDDVLNGGDGADLIFTGLGAASIVGGAGNDTIYADGSEAVGGGDAGDDQIFGTGGAIFLGGGLNNDTLGGSGGNDVLNGDEGNDLVWGYLGNDSCIGDAGVDTLAGYLGNDVLTGGADLDYFIMNYDVQIGSYDNIADFTDGVDLLGLPTYAQGFTYFTDTANGCTATMYLGASTYQIYITGVNAAQIADQVYYYGI